MSTHNHAIIIIRNDNNEYLQYYDNRWDSLLFLNCKLAGNFNNQSIIDHLSDKLKMPNNSFDCNYLVYRVHTKHSESAKKEKEYHHYFYSVDIKKIPNKMQEKEFLIENIKYSWYCLKELENDKRIQQVNSDIVNIVKNLYNI